MTSSEFRLLKSYTTPKIANMMAKKMRFKEFIWMMFKCFAQRAPKWILDRCISG